MSRIGKNPISIPAGVTVDVSETVITVKGKLGQLTQDYADVTVNVEEGQLVVERPSDSKEHRSKHGLYRSLIHNMVVGVSEGFTKELELVGVGYRATNQGQKLDLALGFSHNIVLEIAPEVKLETISEKGKNPIVKLTSYDKQLIGQVAAKIRGFRKPEPYKGKGVKFVGEVLRRKAGKSAKKNSVMSLKKSERRQRIQYRIRKIVSGTAARPRLSVFRSNKEIYTQLIDDVNGVTLLAASSKDKGVDTKGTNIEVATAVGKLVAEKALKAGIDTVTFDRGGYLYHGRIKSLAEGARAAGLKF